MISSQLLLWIVSKDSVEAAIHDSCNTMGMLHGFCFLVASIDKKVRQMTRFHRYFPYSDGQLAIGMVSRIASSLVQSEMKLSLPTVAQLQKGVDGDAILQGLIGSLAAKSSDQNPQGIPWWCRGFFHCTNSKTQGAEQAHHGIFWYAGVKLRVLTMLRFQWS